MKIIKIFKDLIAPKRCYCCKSEGHFLCQNCLEKIGHHESICYCCKQKSRNFDVHFYCQNSSIFYDKILILTHYKDKYIQKLVKDAKFYHRYDILEDFSYYLGNLLLENLGDDIKNIVLVSTPMFFVKKLLRGYNQSEILVKNMAKNLKLEYSTKIIKKIKSTKAQSHLSKLERMENLKGSFIINNKELQKYKNKTFVIVDDVISTGTTINELAKILKKNKIKKIIGIGLASG